MSSQGRGSALAAAALALACLSSVAQASTTYTVGEDNGWSFGAVSWPTEKEFKAGDILVFRYLPEQHDVMVVDKAAYHSCEVPANAVGYHTGEDHIELVPGHHFFMCSFPGHCEDGMRIAVNVLGNE